MFYILLYQGVLPTGKVNHEMSPSPVAGFHQSPKKRKATIQVGMDRLKVKFIPFNP
jgi:hypothetical protein